MQVGGGDVDDILGRFGTVETRLGSVETDVSGIRAQIPYLASKSDVSEAQTSNSEAKTSIIQWVVGTTIAAAALAFAIAKFVH